MTDLCVCTHPRIDHEPFWLSVPLETDTPVELTVSQKRSMYGHIAKIPEAAKRLTDRCWCGCMSFEVDS